MIGLVGFWLEYELIHRHYDRLCTSLTPLHLRYMVAYMFFASLALYMNGVAKGVTIQHTMILSPM